MSVKWHATDKISAVKIVVRRISNANGDISLVVNVVRRTSYIYCSFRVLISDFFFILFFYDRRVTALLWEIKQLERNARLYNEEESQIVGNSSKIVSILNEFTR